MSVESNLLGALARAVDRSSATRVEDKYCEAVIRHFLPKLHGDGDKIANKIMEDRMERVIEDERFDPGTQSFVITDKQRHKLAPTDFFTAKHQRGGTTCSHATWKQRTCQPPNVNDDKVKYDILMIRIVFLIAQNLHEYKTPDNHDKLYDANFVVWVAEHGQAVLHLLSQGYSPEPHVLQGYWNYEARLRSRGKA